MNNTSSSAPSTKGRFWGGTYPTIVDLLAILGVFLIAQIVSLTITHILGYDFDRVGLNSTDILIREAAQIEAGKFSLVSYSITMGITIFTAIILGKIRGNKAPIAHLSIKGFNPSVLLWSMLMLVCVVVIFDPLTRFLPAPPELYGRGWAMVTTLIIAAPILEELLCRGIVLEAVRAKWGVWSACITSALFFSVMHLHPTASLNALVVGIILAYIYIRTSSLFAPIILHAFNNSLAYLLIWLGYENLTLGDIITSQEIYTIIYVSAIITLIISLIKIIRELSRRDKEDKINNSSDVAVITEAEQVE